MTRESSAGKFKASLRGFESKWEYRCSQTLLRNYHNRQFGGFKVSCGGLQEGAQAYQCGQSAPAVIARSRRRRGNLSAAPLVEGGSKFLRPRHVSTPWPNLYWTAMQPFMSWCSFYRPSLFSGLQGVREILPA